MASVIALVDDDRNILTSVSIALQAEGFVTRVYTDGQTALKAFADNPPTWVFSTLRCQRWTEWNCSAECAKWATVSARCPSSS
jgi:two-component system response regulator ChvI